MVVRSQPLWYTHQGRLQRKEVDIFSGVSRIVEVFRFHRESDMSRRDSYRSMRIHLGFEASPIEDIGEDWFLLVLQGGSTVESDSPDCPYFAGYSPGIPMSTPSAYSHNICQEKPTSGTTHHTPPQSYLSFHTPHSSLPSFRNPHPARLDLGTPTFPFQGHTAISSD